MKTNKFISLLFISISILVVLNGCQNSMMVKVQAIKDETTDFGIITVFYPWMGTSASRRYSLWDNATFVGVQNIRTYIQHKVAPGTHFIMAYAGNWSAVKIDVEAGKQYFLVGRLYAIPMKPRIFLSPANIEDTQRINDWLSEYTPLALDREKARNYIDRRENNVRSALENFEKGNWKYITMSAVNGV